ncbi:MAG: hypothetical protein H7175_17570 [Burkholderiales bacterium]|nr:hypothetical protein [Anaerolineae bacterium]
MDDLRTQVTALFSEAGQAHHEAFAQVNGDDAEWPQWYADFVQERLSALLNADISASDIAAALVNLDAEYRGKKPIIDWQQYYAEYFIGRYRPDNSTKS